MRPEILYPLFSPVTRVKGVGPAMAKVLERMLPASGGLPVVRELLFHLPVGLIDRRATYPLHTCPGGVTATFVITVEAYHSPPRRRGGKSPYKVICHNETGDLTLVFFHASDEYLRASLPIGQQRVVSGQTEIFDGRLQMTHPEIIAPVTQLESVQIVEPVYPLTAGLTNRKLAGIIRNAVAGAPELPEWIDSATREQHGFASWHETIAQLHAPQDAGALEPMHITRQRMAYDEILANQLYLALMRGRMQQKPGRAIAPGEKLRAELLKNLPFALTQGQLRAVGEIDADMASGSRMVRLLQGDVGSGKTVVALMAALSAAESGMQTAIMAPTELIARQHAATLARMCEGLPVEICLLTGSVKGRAREAALAEIESGRAAIVVGTHALFQESVHFHQLALIVIDEQHRFGVGQRMALSGKGENPHLLHMSATPIPRSLTMTLYGDMDSTLLTEKPAHRQEITTRVIPQSRMEEVTAGIHRALARGEKLYWICPQIDDDSPVAKDDVAAAEARRITFTTMFGPAVGMVHGRMKPEARDAVMQAFAAGDVRLLVATTVVEVGVDVPDATIIIIEQAERFGLAQLHQLRGRVGRGDKASSCVLLYSDSAAEVAAARLSILRESNDGFRIAEEDLKIRGGGDLLGFRQSGMPAFRFTDLVAHSGLIRQARAKAAEIVQRNSALVGAEGTALKVLLGLYGYEWNY